MKNFEGKSDFLYFELIDIGKLLKEDLPELENKSLLGAYCRFEVPFDFSSLPLHLQEIAIAGAKDALAQNIQIPIENIEPITKEKYEAYQNKMMEEEELLVYPIEIVDLFVDPEEE